MPKIWVSRTTLNGGKKGDGLTSSLFMRSGHGQRPGALSNAKLGIDHFTVVAKLPGLRMGTRLPVTLF